MRNTVLAVIFLTAVVGCARDASAPILPPLEGLSQATLAQEPNDPHRLFGEWTFLINASHTAVEAVPKREGRFHLNALKFLESYCSNCFQITNLKNNGDSTIDLTVKITHPFPGHPEFTGFDVKGILMFDGSWVNDGYYLYPPYPDPVRVSWRKLGDPQLLNADGFTLRWSPWYSSGQPQPIFNYWKGKYSNGTPTANLNAYIDFYTDENRHMFTNYGQVERTYKIWLPPGQPVVAGYAVDACWELPLKTPVIDPASDFPLTANQSEAYKFYLNLNNGEVITDPDCCGLPYDPTEGYMFSKQWGGHTAEALAIFTDYYVDKGAHWDPCGSEWPDEYCSPLFNAEVFPNGEYIGYAVNYRGWGNPPYMDEENELAFTVFEFTIDLE